MTELQAKMAIWRELLELATAYDWAVEDMTPPDNNRLTRAQAATLRGELLTLAGKY